MNFYRKYKVLRKCGTNLRQICNKSRLIKTFRSILENFSLPQTFLNLLRKSSLSFLGMLFMIKI